MSRSNSSSTANLSLAKQGDNSRQSIGAIVEQLADDGESVTMDNADAKPKEAKTEVPAQTPNDAKPVAVALTPATESVVFGILGVLAFRLTYGEMPFAK